MDAILNMNPGNYRENLFGAPKQSEEEQQPSPKKSPEHISSKISEEKMKSPSTPELIDSKQEAPKVADSKPKARLDNFMEFMNKIDDEITSQQERASQRSAVRSNRDDISITQQAKQDSPKNKILGDYDSKMEDLKK